MYKGASALTIARRAVSRLRKITNTIAKSSGLSLSKYKIELLKTRVKIVAIEWVLWEEGHPFFFHA
jgi:hypothetical protein